MANNFFLNQDPLLFQSPFSRGGLNEEEARRQFNETLNQYKEMQKRQMEYQTQQTSRDYLGELDTMVKSLNCGVLNSLATNEEYQKLNNELTSIVQSEIMSNVKWKINSNQDAMRNIERQIELIKNANRQVDDEQRQSLNELNDYVKNYSNITFDEYKRIKHKNKGNNNNGKQKVNDNEN